MWNKTVSMVGTGSVWFLYWPHRMVSLHSAHGGKLNKTPDLGHEKNKTNS